MSHTRLLIALALLVAALIVAIWMMDFADHSVKVEQYYMQIWVPAGLAMMIGALAMHISMSKPHIASSSYSSKVEKSAEGESRSLLSQAKKNEPEDILV
jgi:peptidoglycan/LPS O-acetylase OafA/YrhL